MGSMVEDLIKLWGRFSLSEEERVGIEVKEEALCVSIDREKLCLVRKLLTNRITCSL